VAGSVGVKIVKQLRVTFQIDDCLQTVHLSRLSDPNAHFSHEFSLGLHWKSIEHCAPWGCFCKMRQTLLDSAGHTLSTDLDIAHHV